jgi:3-hydroxybutyryl-CoA dehydratase
LKIADYEDIKVGQKASLEHTITAEDIETFGKLSGDFNPIHFDDEWAKKTIFKGRIAHGLLTGVFISTLLANKLPGPGTVYLNQKFSFKKPVRIGDTIRAEVSVTQKVEDKKHILLGTVCINQHDEIVLEGEARVMLMRIK